MTLPATNLEGIGEIIFLGQKSTRKMISPNAPSLADIITIYIFLQF